MSLDSTPIRPQSEESGPPPARPEQSWWTALRRTPATMWNDDITDYAAALTYYSILAVVPALLVAVLAFELISPATAAEFVDRVTHYAPGRSRTDLHGLLEGMLAQHTATWPLLTTAAASALWSACSYLAVFRRALHGMHRVQDRRSTWRKAHRIVLTALALLVLLLLTGLILVVSGPLAAAVGRHLHMNTATTLAWSLVRWPILVCLVALLVVIVFRTGPARIRRRDHYLPGGVLAALLWLIVTAGFTTYAEHLSTYSSLYGSLAGVAVFLIWLWLSNLALLAGAQFTAELGNTR
ncbi:YihY/virulence factor BrkB family protein [Nocardia nova]|uniref:YihY/virulence factor BrkB family protein n=1 Tax=Nocardia nova TaxID=37330 RepID=UPI0033FB929F